MTAFKKKRYLLLAVLAFALLLLLTYAGFKLLDRFRRMNDWSGMVQKQLGPGFTVKDIYSRDSLLLMDSLSIGSALTVGRITVKKDFYTKLNKAGLPPVVFLFKDARVAGVFFQGGTLSLRLLQADTAEMLLTGMMRDRNGFKPFTAQGTFGGLHSPAFVSRDFRVDAQGLKILFDTLVVGRQGDCHGFANIEARMEALRDFADFPLPVRGMVTVKNAFHVSSEGLESRGNVSADTLQVRGLVFHAFFSPFVKQGERYTFPEFRVNAFGGSATGRAVILDGRAQKACDIVLELKNADLNLLPKKPEGLAFEGRFSGRMDFGGKGATWPEVIRQLRGR